MTNAYRKAYTEVLEIIRHFPKSEYSKIPQEKIDFYKKNMDESYNFTINPSIDLSEQNLSKEANAILVSLYRDYFANEKQKQILSNLLGQNQQILEKGKYNPDEIFKNREFNKNIDVQTVEKTNNTSIIEYKENFFTKFINFIKRLLKLYDK